MYLSSYQPFIAIRIAFSARSRSDEGLGEPHGTGLLVDDVLVEVEVGLPIKARAMLMAGGCMVPLLETCIELGMRNRPAGA